MKCKSIIKLYDENNKKLPFLVKRKTWVNKVYHIKKMFGNVAFGYLLVDNKIQNVNNMNKQFHYIKNSNSNWWLKI